jgi:hypothetical protein
MTTCLKTSKQSLIKHDYTRQSQNNTPMAFPLQQQQVETKIHNDLNSKVKTYEIHRS